MLKKPAAITLVSTLIAVLMSQFALGQSQTFQYNEQWRPQVHFSPQAHWINDPNGMIYNDGVYHLFYQYYPGATVWGPMHWGHAESRDLMHWKEQRIALYPDSLGYIFSGSVVRDAQNTSGFGKNGHAPLVAIFTHHDPKGEQAGRNNFQSQSLAYSTDNGHTWIKYKGNPVLKNPGIRDFRDPKVFWYARQRKWVMTLATYDHITFYSSPDLKQWKKESEFGKELGAHGGVWECPDLFPMQSGGKTYWTLIVNVNPGGPNGGSATQYFVGDFDGTTFNAVNKDIKWLDFGPDEYAGVTWNNTGNRRIFLGWMSNWLYANQVPTEKWRNAMTLPRELTLKKVENSFRLCAQPVSELSVLRSKPKNIDISKTVNTPAQYEISLGTDKLGSFSIELFNDLNERLLIGYDEGSRRYYVDRSRSGKINFNADFGKVAYANRIVTNAVSNIKLVVDASSVELFADDGSVVMTALFFPIKTYNYLKLNPDQDSAFKIRQLIPLKSIW